MNALRQLGLRACRSRISPTQPGTLISSTCRRNAILPTLARDPRFTGNLNLGLKLRHLSSSPPRHVQYVRFGEGPSRGRGFDPKKSNEDRKREVVEKVAIGLVVLGGLYYVVHLERVPQTGRWRFMDVSPRMELKMQEAAYVEILQENNGKILPPNHVLHRHIRRVVSRILEANDLGVLKDEQTIGPLTGIGLGGPSLHDPEGHLAAGDVPQWTLTVVDDKKTVNAAAALRNIIVYTGILPVCKDEQGLAAVLGHEIAHAAARHSAESYSAVKVATTLALLINITLGIDFAGVILNLFMSLPNSRKKEMEADAIGLRLAAKACYDPNEAVQMQARLAAAAGHRSYFLSLLETHPASDVRIQRIREAIPEAYSIKAASPRCSGTSEQVPGFLSALGLHGASDDSGSSFKSLWNDKRPGGGVAERQRVLEASHEVIGTGNAQDEVLVDKW